MVNLDENVIRNGPGLYIQYWCIDGKYRIYVARLRNWGKTSFSECFHSFSAEPHKFNINFNTLVQIIDIFIVYKKI